MEDNVSSPAKKQRILFVCTHNSARSQMAEGLMRALKGSRWEAMSAGTEPRALHPAAVAAMAEIGIDISRQRAKGFDEVAGTTFDEIVTVCDNAGQSCPFFPGEARRRHQSFADPAAVEGTEAEVLSAFRRVRDEIRRWIEATF